MLSGKMITYKLRNSMETLTKSDSSLPEKYFLRSTKKNIRTITFPKISIITVTYNSALTLTDTLKSVQSQDYPNVEHIIIDGNSQDDTVKIIKSFPHITKWVSEK